MNIEEKRQLDDAAADSPDTSEDVLRELAVHESSLVRGRVANRSGLSGYIVGVLADDEVSQVTVNLLANSHVRLPETLLLRLAGDGNRRVRAGVAGRPDITEAVCNILRTDSDDEVVLRLCRNQHTHPSALAELSKNADSLRRSQIAQNLATPVSILKKFLGEDKFMERFDAIRNASLPVELLEKFALSENVMEVAYAMQNPNVTLGMVIGAFRSFPLNEWVLRGLLEHSDVTVEILEGIVNEPGMSEDWVKQAITRLMGTTKYAGYPREWVETAVMSS